jgi:hypothetical protein
MQILFSKMAKTGKYGKACSYVWVLAQVFEDT